MTGFAGLFGPDATDGVDPLVRVGRLRGEDGSGGLGGVDIESFVEVIV